MQIGKRAGAAAARRTGSEFNGSPGAGTRHEIPAPEPRTGYYSLNRTCRQAAQRPLRHRKLRGNYTCSGTGTLSDVVVVILPALLLHFILLPCVAENK